MEKEIAKILLEKNAVKISTAPPFVWTSGLKSPIYCDNRLLISHLNARAKIIEGFKKLIKDNKLEFDVISGTATGAIAWAAFLAAELNKPMVYVRSKPKTHGAGKQVEGTMKKGSRVLIVEDLFSTEGSSIKSAQTCEREFGAKIVAAVAIFTYGFESTKENFHDAKIPFFTLSNFHSLVDILKISALEKSEILKFAKNPNTWQSNL
jgi:orotate phosphoribosyltransferase